MTTDLELVERVRAGETQAFAQLIERYERSVLAAVQAELRDPETAQDVTKTSMLLAYRHLARLPDGSQFGPWLLRIARRKSIEVVRSMPVPVGAGDGLGELDDFYASDPEWIEHEHVLGLVARLPEEERRLVGLRYFDNHSLAEIAIVVGDPVDLVARQISRAMTRLQYWWSREQEQ